MLLVALGIPCLRASARLGAPRNGPCNRQDRTCRASAKGV